MVVFHFYSLPCLHTNTSPILKLPRQKEVMHFKYLSVPQEGKKLLVTAQILGRGRGRGRADRAKEKLKKFVLPVYSNC